MAAIYDGMMRGSEEACLGQWRAELLRELSGAVLEIGAGTGATLSLYPKTVTRLVMCEPDPHMRRKLEAKRGTAANLEISAFSIQDLSFKEKSFDAVVCSLVLCSVPDQAAALAQIRRVLKPGGRLVFLEHVLAEGKPNPLKWQRRIEPGCKHPQAHCPPPRRTAAAIED